MYDTTTQGFGKVNIIKNLLEKKKPATDILKKLVGIGRLPTQMEREN